MAAPRPEITELTMVRRHNILQLMDDGKWDRKKFADKTKVKYATLSASLGPNPKSNIGDKTANAIEASLGKKIGWLDKDRRTGATNGTSTRALSGQPSSDDQPTVSLKAGTLVLKDHPITNYERDAIIALLFADK